MAKLADILAVERQRTSDAEQRQIHLFADGSFFRAYEWSAWLCCIYVKQFQVTRRFIKSADADMLFVGFPQSSLDRLMPENCQTETKEEGHLLINLPDTLMKGEQDRSQEYENWRNTIPMAKAKDKPLPVLADRPVSMTGIMKKVLEYASKDSLKRMHRKRTDLWQKCHSVEISREREAVALSSFRGILSHGYNAKAQKCFEW